MRQAPAHWIRHNAASRVPSRFVFLDTEAKEELRNYDRVQSWRLAVTACDWRPDAHSPWRPTTWAVHRDPDELWRYVSNFTRAGRRTILLAHNLAYDVRVADAFRVLSRVGWCIERLSLHDRALGVVLRRADRSLVLADSMSFLPMGLEKIGALVGTPKVSLPDMDGPEAEWVRRCKVDVSTMRTAVLQLVEWIEREDLGNWQRTGAGQAWSAWRHRFYTDKVLVHDVEAARDAEAVASYTGRCEAWRWGRMRGGPFVEWDLPMAYSQVALDCPVPVRLIGHGTARSTRSLVDRTGRMRYLCRATVDTEVPVLPTKVDGHVAWPVGELQGWWWDVELAEAENFGARVRVAETYKYRAAPALAAWARWIIDTCTADDGRVTPVQQAFAKHLARALIGRFATRYTPWEVEGRDVIGREPVEVLVDVDTGQKGKLLTLGSDTLRGVGEVYGPDACVFVMSWVMAECRRRLWQVMHHAGLDHVLYADTDGVIVDEEGDWRLATVLSNGSLWGLRRKQQFGSLDIMGPRQLIVDGKPRISGVPWAARRVGDDEWAGEVWSTLPGSLAKGELDRVVIKPRSWKVKGVDRRRLHLPEGATAPLVVPWHVPASQVG